MFPSEGEIQVFTDLENPLWTYTIIIKGVENFLPEVGCNNLTISGFELSYPPSDAVSVRPMLKGAAPSLKSSLPNFTLVKFLEVDSKNTVVLESVVRREG